MARRTASDPALPVVGPDAAVMRALRMAGAKEVEIPGAPSWWIIPGQDQARTWQEAVHWMGQCVAGQRKAELDKHFTKTSEWWMAVATVFGMAGTGLAALPDTLAGTSPYGAAIMAMAGAMSALTTVGYRYARARQKKLAAQEKGEDHAHHAHHAHQQPAKALHEADRGPTG